MYTQMMDRWIIWQLYSNFLGNIHKVVHRGCINVHSHQQCMRITLRAFLDCTLHGKAHENFHSVPLNTIALPCTLSEFVTHDIVTYSHWGKGAESFQDYSENTLICCSQRERLLAIKPEV